MVKRRYFWVLLPVIAVLLVFAAVFFWKHQPFATLNDSDVLTAHVHFGAYEPEELTSEEKAQLLGILRNVEYYGSCPTMRSVSGPGTGWSDHIFVLQMADGTEIAVSAIDNMFIYQGKGHFSDRDDCEALLTMFQNCIPRIRGTSE